MDRRAAMAIVLGAAAAAAQDPVRKRKPASAEPEPDQPRSTLRVDTNVVLVPVVVYDHMGRVVNGLEQRHFRVFEDRLEQQIVAFSQEDVPIAVGFVFDKSGSMSGGLSWTREAVARFMNLSDPEDEYLLVTFGSRPDLTVPLTKDNRRVLDALMYVKAGGSTALLDGAYLAVSEMRKSKLGRKALILLSDGLENSSRYTMGELKDALSESDLQIFSICYGDGGLLHALADLTGGRAFPFSSRLTDVAEKIAVQMRNQYLIGYRPSNLERDGKLRRIGLELLPPRGMPKLQANWRRGYFAPDN